MSTSGSSSRFSTHARADKNKVFISIENRTTQTQLTGEQDIFTAVVSIDDALEMATAILHAAKEALEIEVAAKELLVTIVEAQNRKE